MTNADESDQILPITEHELAALTTLTDGAAPATSARLLGLEEMRGDAGLVRAGLATLLVRGFGEVGDGVFTASDKGEVLAAILGSAHDWVRVHVAAGGSEGVSAFVASELATLFIDLQPTGTYAVRPLPAEFSVPQLVAGFVGASDGEPVVPPPFQCRIVRLSPDAERAVDFAVPARGQVRIDETDHAADAAWGVLAGRLGYPVG